MLNYLIGQVTRCQSKRFELHGIDRKSTRTTVFMSNFPLRRNTMSTVPINQTSHILDVLAKLIHPFHLLGIAFGSIHVIFKHKIILRAQVIRIHHQKQLIKILF